MTYHHHAPDGWESSCACGAPVYADSFRDLPSYQEFHLSGLCQACQDTVFLGATDDAPPVQYALRRGAVAACTKRLAQMGIVPSVGSVGDSPDKGTRGQALRQRLGRAAFTDVLKGAAVAPG